MENQVESYPKYQPHFYLEPSDYYEGYKDGRAETIEKIKESIKFRLIEELGLEGARKYGNKNAKQQANSYATIMKYEIADCVDDLLDDLEQLKEQSNE